MIMLSIRYAELILSAVVPKRGSSGNHKRQSKYCMIEQFLEVLQNWSNLDLRK
jgi:hypothetical protein